MATAAPVIRQRFFDANGNPLSGGKLYSYQAGTTTPQVTYTDSSGGTPNANPVVLDSNGEADVWLDPTLSYKFTLTNSSDVEQWTKDGYVGLITAGAVVTASLADDAVTEDKIADDAVTADKLRDDASTDSNRAVTTNHIRDEAVTRAKLASSSYKSIAATDNIGLSYSTNTLSITQADGSALSSSSPGFVNIQRTSGGGSINLKVDGASHSFTDDGGSSDIVGEEFGVDTGVAWGNSRPFYIYAVNSDDTDSGIAFAISPNPCAIQSPATANCGYHGAPASSPSDKNFFFLTSANVTATHNEKPCTRIGGVRMVMSASDDWTVQSLDYSSGDGIRPDPFVGQWFDMPTGQMGANSGSYLSVSGGGTAPSWASAVTYKYRMNINGECEVVFNTTAGGNATNGSGSNLLLSFPFYFDESIQISGGNEFPCGSFLASSASPTSGVLTLNSNSATLYNKGFLSTYSSTSINADDFSTTADDLRVRFSYQAFS